jgi:hypothetical protein
MTKQDVVNLMRSSRSQEEWNQNARLVKNAFGGDYPAWWFQVLVQAGLLVPGRDGTRIVRQNFSKPTVN